MKRRAAIAQILAPFAFAAQRFGAVNPPACAVCHTPFDADVPEYALVVSDAGQWVSLPNTRVLVCQKCGVLQLSAK